MTAAGMTYPQAGSGEHLTMRSLGVLLHAAEQGRYEAKEEKAMMFMGDDWAEDHDDVEQVGIKSAFLTVRHSSPGPPGT